MLNSKCKSILDLNTIKDSSSDLNIDSDTDDINSRLTVGTIIGINKPTLSNKSTPLLFYVRIDGKSYKSCQWVTKEEICKTQKGTFLYNLYASKHKTFYLFMPFKLNPSFSSNRKFNLYIPFNSTFDIGHITPEYVISSRKTSTRKEYLVKWLSLDIMQSTWEKKEDVPLDLIDEFKKRKKNPHPICFDPRNNEKEVHFEAFKGSPQFKNGNKLTDYQVDGLNWLQMCWFQRTNSILSDEMGLGKTIESISILDALSKWYPSWGPFLVVCPLSTVANWLNEFKKWTDFRVVSLIGNKESRKIIKNNMIYFKNKTTDELEKDKVIFDVLVVSYEWLNAELKFIKQFNFMYTIIDEAQRIKNEKTLVYKNCLAIRSYHFLLMTGTPIQNNLFEIWSLLHFIAPSKFENYEEFESKYDDKENSETIEKLQEVLQPYIFRRKKNDVNLDLPEKEETIIEVEMTQIQRSFSQIFYKDNFEILNESLNKISLNNIMMQLRKLYCHPYLFPDLENMCNSQYKEAHNIPYDAELSVDDEIKSLILASGKTILIDKLLPKLKEGNHKVLFFSQFTSVLDILEDYLTYKQYPYERLDGRCNTNDRMRSIDKFQNDKESFIFLLSTRAGGLGINLTKADTVIIYDSDWNPQNDIQAQARCHRIGQSNKVRIYRLVTRGSYESEMFERASKKLALDYAILDSAPKGSSSRKSKSFDNKKELEMILKKGAYYTFKDDSSEIDKFCSENIDQILEHRSHTRKDVVSGGNSKFSKASFETNHEEDVYKNDFWDQLVEEQTAKEDSNNKKNQSTKIVTRKRAYINYSESRKRTKNIQIKDYQNIIHFSPTIQEEESDLGLKDMKLSDLCDLNSFTQSIDLSTYEKALSTLKHNGICWSRSIVPESIHDICRTLLVLAFFGCPLKHRKSYYSYVKELIPDFSKQLNSTPFKELIDKFANSVSPCTKLRILDEAFNWDILYKIVLYITTEKLPNNFKFAPEMHTYDGWTAKEDFIAITSYLFADKHTNFVEDEDLPFKSMIEQNPSMKLWIFDRIKIILFELYLYLPKSFSIYEPNDKMKLKKIGNLDNFSLLNHHVLYPIQLPINMQKKLLKIFYLYGIPRNGINKIKMILNEEIISEEAILIFTVKFLIKALKYHPNLVGLLRSLPRSNKEEIYRNIFVDISWINEEAFVAVASNVDLLFRVRQNCLELNLAKYCNFESNLGKWDEIIENYSWWDFQCDIVLFNMVASYGFLFNSMLCYYLIPNKPKVFASINENDAKNWKKKELLNLEPIIIEKMEFLKPILSFELKKKRVNQINNIIELYQKKQI